MSKDNPPSATDNNTLQRTRPTTSQTGQVNFQTSQTSSLQLDEEEAMSDEEGVVSMEPHVPAPPPSHSMTATMGLNTHRIQVMKASFFGTDQEKMRGGVSKAGNYRQQQYPVGFGEQHMAGRLLTRSKQSDLHSGMGQRLGQVQFRDTPSPIPHLPPDTSPSLSSHYLRSHPTPLPTPSQSLLEFAGESSMHHSSDLSTSTSLYSSAVPSQTGRWPRPRAPPTSSLLQMQSSVLVARTDLNVLVPPSHSMVCGRTRMAADAGLFLGRSFRVGWGPNWTLSHSGCVSHSGSSIGHSLQVVVEKVYPTPFMINAPPQKISVSATSFLYILDTIVSVS